MQMRLSDVSISVSVGALVFTRRNRLMKAGSSWSVAQVEAMSTKSYPSYLSTDVEQHVAHLRGCPVDFVVEEDEWRVPLRIVQIVEVELHVVDRHEGTVPASGAAPL